ncbi:uncharacterized protein J3D65DRAFT_247493 [Phyllosticta citribraziliensis]|uniref:Uncharacterized protein n=1 Tax=Phyllosticta citribraziliensis TaxID=989973 RepID=A0ABR1LZN6_9PEZI
MEGFKAHVTIDEAIPQAQRVIGNAYPAFGDPEALRLFQEGATQFKNYYINGRPDPPRISRAFQVFYDNLKEMYETLATKPWLEDQYGKVFTDASRQMWGLNFDEAKSVADWVTSGARDHANLEAALRKINPVKTWTITQQNPPTEVVNMLIKAESVINCRRYSTHKPRTNRLLHKLGDVSSVHASNATCPLCCPLRDRKIRSLGHGNWVPRSLVLREIVRQVPTAWVRGSQWRCTGATRRPHAAIPYFLLPRNRSSCIQSCT